MNQKQLLFWNTCTSLIFQITTIICGFILPRVILKAYGSDVNGLVNSIAQFLSLIGFLDLGVGAVVQSSLYKPLATKDFDLINQIVTSAGLFFRRIGQILAVYVIVLIIIYPSVLNREFDFLFTGTLIAAISISYFAQYYFGVVDRLFLVADQHGYIQYNIQTITLVLNTMLCFLLIHFNASIQTVKLGSSLVYLIRPIYLRSYINSHYSITRNIKYKEEPIKQKWNGVAQHIAAVVLDQTDVIVLTAFATLKDVSIYAVYYMVVNGVKQLFMSMTNGIQALLGEYWAKEERDKLQQFFNKVEWIIHNGVVVIFGSTLILIVSFIRVYTEGVTDANYIQPLFGVLLTLANACHCLRLPYNIMILASGHYKQTQKNYIIAAVVNLTISIAMVFKFGLIGVAIGTLAAMLYQTIWMAYYDSKHLVHRSVMIFWKQFYVDVISIVVACQLTKSINMEVHNYISWVILAVKIFVIVVFVDLSINYIFYRRFVEETVKSVFTIFKKLIRKVSR